MKGFVCTTLAVAALIGAAAVSTAHAQMTERMQFTTAFPFTAGHTRFPAGTYTVGPIDDNNLDVLRLTGGHHAAFIPIVPEGIKKGEPADNVLTFVRYGDVYYLSDIWDTADQSDMTPTQFLADQRREPQRTVAERIAVPFVKIS